MRPRLRDRIERAAEALWEGRAPLAYLLLWVPLFLASLVTRVFARRRPARRKASGCRVVSVGSLHVGGSGKTPVVLELSARAAALGIPAAVVLRGYGGDVAGPTRVASDGDPDRFGDEAVLHARRSPRTLVIVSRERRAGVELARACGARLVFLDDGFQQRRIAPDRSVVVLPAEAPLGNGRLLPLGPLREPPSRLSPEDVLWLHGEPGRRAVGLPIAIRSRLRPAGLVAAGDLAADPAPTPSGPVAAFCAIARPGRFFGMVEAAGLRLAARWPLGDHRPISAAELRAAAARAAGLGASALVCTEKDAARLRVPDDLALPVYALRVSLSIEAGEERVAGLLSDGSVAARAPNERSRGDR